MWLSLLVRVPFDLTTIDSTSASGVTLIDSLILTGQSYLSDPGATRDMAAVFLSQVNIFNSFKYSYDFTLRFGRISFFQCVVYSVTY